MEIIVSNILSYLGIWAFIVDWKLEMNIISIKGVCDFCLHLRNILASDNKNLLIYSTKTY